MIANMNLNKLNFEFESGMKRMRERKSLFFFIYVCASLCVQVV